MSKFEAVIFDMDGTIIDSESFAFNVWKSGLLSFGLDLKKEIFTQMVGRSVNDSNLILRENFPDFDPTELRKKVRELEPNAYETTPILEKKGATEILNYLRNQKKIKLGLATSTEKVRAETRLSKLNLINYFHEMVFGDQVENHKPDPEIYLKASKKLNVDISKTLIIEDSEAGVMGALKSGGSVIWIKDMVDINESLKDSIFLRLENLLEVKELFSKED